MGWPCYWLDPAGTVALGLRRYARLAGRHEWTCEAGWHEAFTWRGLTAPEQWAEEADGWRHHPVPVLVDHADPAWPAACGHGCGYTFAEADEWQEWEEAIYRAPSGGLEVLHQGWPPPPGMAQAGPGAMWDAWWLPAAWKGSDGIGLAVRLPRPDQTPGWCHDWLADGPATGGGTWTRTGNPQDPPSLSVTPSIAAGQAGTPGYYHGYLTGGVLTDHLG